MKKCHLPGVSMLGPLGHFFYSPATSGKKKKRGHIMVIHGQDIRHVV